MITSQNLKAYFENINDKHLQDVWNADSDYISCFITGNHGYCCIESFDYGSDDEEDILSTGGFIADKDDFLRLYDESGAKNPYIDENILCK